MVGAAVVAVVAVAVVGAPALAPALVAVPYDDDIPPPTPQPLSPQVCDLCSTERWQTGVYHCWDCDDFDICLECSGQLEEGQGVGLYEDREKLVNVAVLRRLSCGGGRSGAARDWLGRSGGKDGREGGGGGGAGGWGGGGSGGGGGGACLGVKGEMQNTRWRGEDIEDVAVMAEVRYV